MSRLKLTIRSPHRRETVSLLRPAAIKEARGKRERNEITAEALRSIEDREIEKTIDGYAHAIRLIGGGE